ncbi:MAG TPA: tetratricopeptide repeat protein [Bacteroidia bacterium]|nr:tetratricopeptide repeat protein [Bacteroidia bacterium]
MVALLKEHKKIILSFFVLSFLFYGNSLKNKYALDDDYITVTNFPVKGQPYYPNNELVKNGIKGIPKIWKSRYAHDAEASFEYRPVTTSSFAIEYGIFGQNPFISHLLNIIIYFISICLLFFILLVLFEKIDSHLAISYLVCLFFLIHPIHTEVVNNIKCRDELFAMFFPLCAFWFSLSFYKKPNTKDVVFIVLFMLLGLLSKRSSMVFIAIIPLALIFFREISFKLIAGALTFLTISYLSFIKIKSGLITEKNVRHFYDFENPLYVLKVSFFTKVGIAIKSLGFYIKMLFFPVPLRFYYGNNVIDLLGKPDIYFIIGICFLIGSGAIFYKTRNKLFLFGLLLFLGSIFPFLNFIVPVAGVFGERLTYISTIGFSIMVISFLSPYIKDIDFTSLNKMFSKPKVYGVSLVAVCMIYTWNRNTNWYNKITLFEHDITSLEKSAKANSLLANEYFEMLRSNNKKYSDQIIVQKAIKHYSQAVTNDSSFFSAYNNAGVIYYSYLNDFKTAKKLFTLAIRHRALYSQAYENLGNCFKQEKNIKTAFWCYKKSYEINSKQYSAYIAAITMFFEVKDYDKCLEIIDITRFNIPNNYQLTAQEANCYLMKNNTKKALEKYEEAYKMNPNQNLAQFLLKKYLEIGDTLNSKRFKVL